MRKSLAALLIATAFSAPAAAEGLPVVATIKPVHSLVANVTAGVSEPYLIVKGAASPHTYALRPTDAEAIQKAGAVIWLGHDFELFLESAIETLAPKARLIELGDSEGLTILPPREGGTFEAHEHEDEDHDHGEERDLHIWLDPANAAVLVGTIAAGLSEADPANAAAYKANAETTKAKLEALTAEIEATIAPVKDKGFIVFHDAYQYFERRFGVKALGSVTVSPEVMPGVQRLEDLRQKVAGLEARCVFAEPNFEPKLIDAIIEGTGAGRSVLDPEGASLGEGSDLYFQLMRNLARNLRDCLS